MVKITVTQVLLIILAILILLWLINWYVSCQRNKNTFTSELANRYQSNQTNDPYNLSGHFTKEQFTTDNQLINNGQSIQTSHYNPPGTPFILYYFYNPACVYCKEFNPVWNALTTKLNSNLVTSRIIDGIKPENDDLTFYYNITGYPTIILVTPVDTFEYNGERNPDDLYNFIAAKIAEYGQTSN